MATFAEAGRVDNPEWADHHTHPAGDARWLIDINEACLRIPAHRSIGTGFDARSVLTMPALKGKVLSLHIHTGDGMRLFVNRLMQFFGHRADFCPAPELTLMASCAFCFVYDEDFHFFLPSQA
jgi:hypothetical protein